MEALVTCDESENNSINFWNPSSGTKILTLRSPPINSSSLSFIRNEGLLITEFNKPFIHFWQSGQPLQNSRRILCSGKPGPAAIHPDGTFLAVGIEEKMNIWQVSTGKTIIVLNSHYRPLTILKFSDGGTFLLSAGQDGMILVFRFLTLVSKATTTPIYSWSDHSFPITGLHIGVGSKPTVFSVSLDRTIKIYSLLTGTIMLSVSFPLPLTTVVADPAEFAFYVGASNGCIYQMKLHSPPRSIEHHVSSDAAADHVFKHSDSITALCISADGKTLASSDQLGEIYIWDIGSHQQLKTIVGNKAKVTNLSFWLGNPENLKGNQKPTIVFPEVPKLVEAVEQNRASDVDVVTVWNRIENMEDISDAFPQNSNMIENSAQISNLKAQLTNSEVINKKLHQFYVENILGEG